MYIYQKQLNANAAKKIAAWNGVFMICNMLVMMASLSMMRIMRYLDSRFWRPPRAPIHIPQPAVTTARTPTTLRWTFYNWVGLRLIGAIGFALLLTTPTSIVLMGIGIHPEHKADQRYSRLTIIIFALFKFKVPNFKQFLGRSPQIYTVTRKGSQNQITSNCWLF